MVRKFLQGIGARYRVSVKLSLVLGPSLRESVILMVRFYFSKHLSSDVRGETYVIEDLCE